MPSQDIDAYLARFRRRNRVARRVARLLPEPTRLKFLYDVRFRNEIEAVAFPLASRHRIVPNFETPTRYYEKVRGLYLTHPNPLLSLVADKVRVRDYAAYCGVSVPFPDVLQVFERPEDLDWDALPGEWVMKVNDGSKMNLISTRAAPVSRRKAMRVLRGWHRTDHWRRWSELHYRDIPRRFLVERYMPGDTYQCEYLVACVMGTPIYVNFRTDMPETRRASYLPDWRPTDIGSDNRKPIDLRTPPPKDFDLILDTARRLSRNLPHARVDFMRYNDQLVLSEITLTNNAAIVPFRSPFMDRMMSEPYDMSRLPDCLATGRRIAADLGWPLETSYGHFAGDPRLVTGGIAA